MIAPETGVIWLYWAMSGYGLKAWRAICWFFAVAVLGAVLYSLSDPFDPYAAGEALDFGETFQFSFESMVSLLQPPGDDLDFWEHWLQLTERVLGPVLLAQAVLAIRERVAR